MIYFFKIFIFVIIRKFLFLFIIMLNCTSMNFLKDRDFFNSFLFFFIYVGILDIKRELCRGELISFKCMKNR